jgi:hypothetical protein
MSPAPSIHCLDLRPRRKMYSDKFPKILSFILKHATRIGACYFQFNAKQKRFFTNKRDGQKCMVVFLFSCSYTVFAIVQTIRAKINSNPDFAMCYVLTLILCLIVGNFGLNLDFTHDGRISATFTTFFRGCKRFQSKLDAYSIHN